MAINIIEKFQCCECGELHDCEDDAHECCKPEIREVYQCPICKEVYRESGAAAECLAECKDENPQFKYMASIEELESLGQQRLFN